MIKKYTFDELYPAMFTVAQEIKERFNVKDYPDRTAFNAARLGALNAFKSISKDWNNIVWMEIRGVE